VGGRAGGRGGVNNYRHVRNYIGRLRAAGEDGYRRKVEKGRERDSKREPKAGPYHEDFVTAKFPALDSSARAQVSLPRCYTQISRRLRRHDSEPAIQQSFCGFGLGQQPVGVLEAARRVKCRGGVDTSAVEDDHLQARAL
jgi:hypothetical protein